MNSNHGLDVHVMAGEVRLTLNARIAILEEQLRVLKAAALAACDAKTDTEIALRLDELRKVATDSPAA